MCGILCCISYSQCQLLSDLSLLQRIKNRGPDDASFVVLDVNDKVKITFWGSVLWMQGSSIVHQPVENNSGVLLYNGDIFDPTWDKTISDTHQIMNKFNKVSCNSGEVVNTIKTFKGPFSLIFYCKTTNNVFIARDKIGRNSLLVCKSGNSLIISSVLARNYKCMDVPAEHILVYNTLSTNISVYSWENEEVEEHTLESYLDVLEAKQNTPDEKFLVNYKTSLNENLQVDVDVVKYIENIAKEAKSMQSLLCNLLLNVTIYNTVIEIITLLENSIKLRLERQPNKCKDCVLEKIDQCHHCSVGILFSGGLDCTLLAFLADKYLPKTQSIDLLNVAFNKDTSSSFEVPDRKTGIQSYKELQSVCPSRKWVFKEINVTKEEMIKQQKEAIADLVYPRQTILDESLGTALWFAARGEDKNSSSTCRVVLVGSGADELFGGYSRHRNAFKRLGWIGLEKELLFDWSRISFRNLARDNRVICDHGRQPRMPYLDEDLTKFVLNLKPWLKCFPSEALGAGVGEKFILRLVAFHLKLEKVALYPKRALQFGSRIANKKDKGCDISKKLYLANKY